MFLCCAAAPTDVVYDSLAASFTTTSTQLHSLHAHIHDVVQAADVSTYLSFSSVGGTHCSLCALYGPGSGDVRSDVGGQ